ncbi:MAG TPA: hypothetical protein VM940_08310 [Chthoniobacterales bacterium]|jgi:hypothetical protein|nr:hypothetical protein [Chthoniobacterales bacterium]
MNEPQPSLPAGRPIGPTLLGILVANAIGGLLLAPGVWVVRTYKEQNLATLIAWPSFFLLPIIVGLVAAWFWRHYKRTLGWSFLDAFWVALAGVAAAAIVLREGAVCMVIAFPLLYIFILTGVLLGRLLFRPKSSTLQLTVFPFLALLTVGEMAYHSEKQAVVIDQLVINAPPAKVWPHVLAFSEIPDAPDYWIFRLGLPYPTQTTNGGNFVGADRQCMFSDGIVIKERVAEFVPEEKLTFDIIEQPTHPEAYGHISLHRGRFELRDNRDGTTTLIGSSWYTLHVRPRWYFDIWTQDMTRAVHLRVMNHVKRLAESSPQ